MDKHNVFNGANAIQKLLPHLWRDFVFLFHMSPVYASNPDDCRPLFLIIFLIFGYWSLGYDLRFIRASKAW
jgi:hypothetical protein